MSESVKKNYLYNILYEILVLIIPLITAPYLSRILGSERIGEYTFSYSIVSYFILFGRLGIVNHGCREIAKITSKIERSRFFLSLITIQFASFLLVLLGYLLKRFKFLNDEFLQVANKFCFYVALPVLLFKNLYDSSLIDMPWKLIIFSVSAIITIFLLATLYAIIFVKDKRQKGVMIQAIMRSNYAFIGIPLATSLFSDNELIAKTGTMVAIMSIFCIPLFNMLSVIALSMFVDEEDNKGHIKKVLLDIAKNPLIIAILCGLLVLIFRMIIPTSSFVVRDHVSFLYKTIEYIAKIASPLALIIVGGQFEFTTSKENRILLIIGVSVRMVLVPTIIFTIAILLDVFANYEFATLIAIFASPIAVVSAIMAKEMKNDHILASKLVVWSTAVSSVTIFLAVFVLKSLGYL